MIFTGITPPLTETQQRRLSLRKQGYSRSQIAAVERVTPDAVTNTFKEIIRRVDTSAK